MLSYDFQLSTGQKLWDVRWLLKRSNDFSSNHQKAITYWYQGKRGRKITAGRTQEYGLAQEEFEEDTAPA